MADDVTQIKYMATEVRLNSSIDRRGLEVGVAGCRLSNHFTYNVNGAMSAALRAMLCIWHICSVILLFSVFFRP